MDEIKLPPLPIDRRRQKRRLRSFATTIFTLLAAILYSYLYPEQLQPITTAIQDLQPGYYRVIEVVDGDTIKISMDGNTDTVRLIGIDTPETHDPRKPVQCFGQAAQIKAQQIMAQGAVRLEADPADSDRDKYRRLLRYVYLPDGTFVNGEMVRQGYAFAYTIFPNSKLDQFRTWELEAKTNNRGLWAGCHIDESKDVKQTTNQR